MVWIRRDFTVRHTESLEASYLVFGRLGKYRNRWATYVLSPCMDIGYYQRMDIGGFIGGAVACLAIQSGVETTDCFLFPVGIDGFFRVYRCVSACFVQWMATFILLGSTSDYFYWNWGIGY